ncbi:MAG: flagellar basal body-associated FliL family protein [Spirochaetes bacterium]|nr:flagellar basal body-associated FliL family protein [Spirochaetota bacterium]
MMTSLNKEDNTVQIAGDELDEPGDEESIEISGNELDEPGDEESKSFAGKELNESKNKKSKALPKEKNKSKGKKKLFLFFVTGICLLAGGVYYFSQNKNEKEITSRVKTFPISHDQSFILDSFIIPFKGNQRITYISLNISFKLSNRELMEEMLEKKGQLRGIIYDILGEEINKVKDAPSIQKLKELIIRGVNKVLAAGEVSEAIITDFLPV